MSVRPSRARDGPSLDRGQRAPTLPPSGLQWRLATAADPLQPPLSLERASVTRLNSLCLGVVASD